MLVSAAPAGTPGCPAGGRPLAPCTYVLTAEAQDGGDLSTMCGWRPAAWAPGSSGTRAAGPPSGLPAPHPGSGAHRCTSFPVPPEALQARPRDARATSRAPATPLPKSGNGWARAGALTRALKAAGWAGGVRAPQPGPPRPSRCQLAPRSRALERRVLPRSQASLTFGGRPGGRTGQEAEAAPSPGVVRVPPSAPGQGHPWVWVWPPRPPRLCSCTPAPPPPALPPPSGTQAHVALGRRH